jgi:hypothetical protein
VYPGQAVDDPDLEDEAPPDKPLADPAEVTIE